MTIFKKNQYFLTGSVGAAALLWSTAGFTAGQGPTIIDRWIEESKSISFLDMSYQGLSYDEVSDVTEVTGLKVIFAPSFENLMPSGEEVPKFTYSFEAPTMRYTALAETGNRYSADIIEAPTVSFDFVMEGGPKEMELASNKNKGSYNGIIVKDADWAKLPEIVDDPLKPVSKYYPVLAALADGNFASMEISGAKTEQSFDAETILLIEYGPITVGDVKSGDYSTFLMDGISMKSVGMDSSGAAVSPTEFTMNIGRIEGADYNGGTLIRQFDPALPLSQRDTSFETMVGRIAALDIQVAFEDNASFKIAEVSYSDWGVRPPSVPLLKQFDELAIKAEKDGSEIDEIEMIRSVASLYAMFRIGSFDMKGFDLNFEDDSEQMLASLGSFRIADLWSGGLGEFSIKDLKMEGDGNLINSDLFQIRDIGFPTLDALMDMERATDEMDIAAIVAGLPTIGLIESAGVDMKIADETDMRFDRSSLEMGNFIGRLPTKASTVLENLEIRVSDLEDEARENLEKLGYERIKVSYALSLLWDEATEILSVSNTNTFDEGGDLNADVEIGGVPRSVFENPETAQNALAFLTFNGASVVFDDNSIVDRVLASTAEDQGKSPEQLKQELLGMLPFAMGALNKPEFVSEVSSAISKLLADGDTLTATAKPGTPVSVMQVIAGGAAAPGALVDLLKVEVTAE